MCEKWRLLPPGTYESEDQIPSEWECSLNPDGRYNSCDIPEEQAAAQPAPEEPPPKKKSTQQHQQHHQHQQQHQQQERRAVFEDEDLNEQMRIAMEQRRELDRERDRMENEDGDDLDMLENVGGNLRLQKRLPPPQRVYMEVPEFFRRNVPVWRQGAQIGTVRLSERETIGDVRNMVRDLAGLDEPFVLLKKKDIPLPPTQDFKRAHYFFQDESSYISIK